MQALSQDDARALVSRVRSGDAEAFERILHSYWAPLVRFARRVLPEADDPQDVVQDVFVKLWKRRDSLSVDGSVQALLFTMTRNAALDGVRRRDRHARAMTGYAGSGSEALPAQVAAAEELAAAARAAVAALPPKRREVYRLVREEGLTYEEVAEVLTLSPQTVANHMSLALADLRKALRHHLPAGT